MERTSFSDALRRSNSLLDSVEGDRRVSNELVLIHLFWRMLDAQTPNPILNDQHAVEVLNGCDADLNKPYFVNDE